MQFLIIQKMERMFDLTRLRKQGILQAVVPMHDDQGLFYLHEKYRKPHRFIPHPFATFKAFFMEDYDTTRFSDMMSYMHYFGERQGISNTFFEFCTIYMLVPAILSLLLTVYQYAVTRETTLSVFYAVFIAIWTTYMIERWKRKEHHIAYKWGAIHTHGVSDDEIIQNPDYVGYESFSWSNYFLSKKNPSKRGTVYLVLNIFVSLALMATSMTLYVLIKNFATSGLSYIKQMLMTSVVLTVVTGGINFLYKFIADFFVTKENHKYMKDKDRSFMLKLVLFRLVNTNMTIIYALGKILAEGVAASAEELEAAEGGADVEEPSRYRYISGVILFTVVSKAIDPTLSRYLFRYVRFQILKGMYFSEVNKLAKA